MTGSVALAREYYRTIDADEYDALADLLAPAFVHERPDRTLSGRDRFVAFTRDERPMTETTHVVEAVYDVGPADSGNVAVQGRLLDVDGATLFAFVDVFTVGDCRLTRLETYVRTDPEDD